jgi:phage I-like protein
LVESIVYLPEGKHEIAATVNGKPAKRTVTVDDSILAAFADDLQNRQSRNVRPFAGFDHKAGPASFIPVEFRYEKGVGLILDVEWTQAGKTAVEGKDYSYFSPAFLLRDGIPAGLPTHGEIGSLVNEPAFEAMEKIAASYNENTMDMKPLIDLGLVPADTAPEAALELAQAALAELRTQAAENVQAAANHASELESITAARDTLANEVETLKASLAKVEDEAADAVIDEAVKAGRIAPQDDKAKTFWKAQIKADKANVEILNSIPAKPVNGETVLAGKTEGEAKETELTGIAKVEAAFKAQKESH